MDTIEAQRQLSDRDMAILQSETANRKLSSGVAYLLWFFFGTWGVHKFYLRKWLAGLIYLSLFGFGWVFFLGSFIGMAAAQSEEDAAAVAGMGSIGMLAIFLLAILLLIDLFTIPRQVEKHYSKLRNTTLKRLQSSNE